MPKLNQILAIEKGTKTRTYAAITELERFMGKEALHSGISRTYRPLNDSDPEIMPSESQIVQINAPEMLQEVEKQLGEAWGITATKEWANAVAKADVVLEDGTKLLTGVPVGYLFYLEKQLVDVRTILDRMPTLDLGERWSWSAEANAYASDMKTTNRVKATRRVLVKALATKEHPEQTEVYTEDVIVGYWDTVKFSGAMPAARRQEMSDRVEAALRAVKIAREAANVMDVTVQQQAPAPLLEFLFS